jgi:2'-5' RNA ligase
LQTLVVKLCPVKPAVKPTIKPVLVTLVNNIGTPVPVKLQEEEAALYTTLVNNGIKEEEVVPHTTLAKSTIKKEEVDPDTTLVNDK